MALDIYIYLKGGRGDGFVPNWNGTVAEEGTLTDGKGEEMSEPYRDIFQQGGQRFYVSETIGGLRAEKNVDGHYIYYLPPGNAYYATAVTQEPWAIGSVGGAPIKTTLTATASDDLSHTKPRQYTKVCTWLVFSSLNSGTTSLFKFRKADVIGWGTKPRAE